MRLYLSNASPFNCTYIDAEGQALYSVRTPSKIFRWSTTIYPATPDDPQDMDDRFGPVAHFEWKSFRSSRLHLKGKKVRTRSFFRKTGWGWHATVS
jgi:hypothetical protein